MSRSSPSPLSPPPSGSKRKGQPRWTEQPLPKTEYELLDLLDRLESLVEDMDDLHVRTRDEAEALIATIHERLDTLERADG